MGDWYYVWWGSWGKLVFVFDLVCGVGRVGVWLGEGWIFCYDFIVFSWCGWEDCGKGVIFGCIIMGSLFNRYCILIFGLWILLLCGWMGVYILYRYEIVEIEDRDSLKCLCFVIYKYCYFFYSFNYGLVRKDFLK